MKKYGPYILLCLFLLIPLADLLNQGLPVTHDNEVHLARIGNFYTSLQEGNIIPRWAQNLNWGYGHPILMFLYPLSAYLVSLFHLFGFSYIDALKIVYAISFISSGLAMYIWARKEFNNTAGFGAALLYTFAPYRFVDLYVRGALGEHVAFIFPPLILYCLFKLAQTTGKEKAQLVFWMCLTAISTSLLILSHNMLSIMFLPFIAGYILVLIIRQKKKYLFMLTSTSSVFYGFFISSFFWIPAFLEGKYTLRDIVTRGEAITRFESLGRLLYSPWKFGGTGEFSVQLGIVALLLLATSFIFFKKIRQQKKLGLYILCLVSLIISIFMMIKISEPLYVYVTIFQKFQFPWRFLSLSVLSLSIIGGLVIFIVSKKYQNFLLSVLTIAILLLTFSNWSARDYKNYPDTFFEDVYSGTTDGGESSPIWSVRFMEKESPQKVEVIEGEAVINNFKENSTMKSFMITAETPSRIKVNTLYFPGWNAYNNTQPLTLEFQDRNHQGLMTFNVPEGESNVTFLFKDTKIRKASSYLSLITGIILIFSLIVSLSALIWQKKK